MPKQLAILERRGARIGTALRALVLAEPAEHDLAAAGLDAAQSSAVPETLAADMAEEPHAYAHSPQRANRSPEPARKPARLPVAAALVLECFCRCILYAMFSTFTEAACLRVAAHAAVSLGTVPWDRMLQPPRVGPARRHATSASAAAIHQRDGP